MVLLICSAVHGQTGIFSVFSSGEMTPDLYGRTDAREFYSGLRILENMYTWAQGPVTKRPGTYFVAEVASGVLTAEIPATSTPGTYSLTYISAIDEVWGIPLGNIGMNWTFETGAVVDEGGGIVSLPAAGHPFTAGETIVIHNTANYEGSQTVHANTTDEKIHITDTFVSETLDGGETAVKHIDGLDTGETYLVRTADGTMYYGHDRKGSSPNIYFITRIDTDGTTSTSDNWLDEVFGTSSSQCRGLALSPDDAFLYMWRDIDVATDVQVMYKFNLSTGATVWANNEARLSGGFDMGLDAGGNTYGAMANNRNYKKYDSDGNRTELVSRHGVYNTKIDDDIGILIGAGNETDNFNIWATSLADISIWDGIMIGTSLISRNWITTDGTNIFVVALDSSEPNFQLYRLIWDGADLAIELQADGPADHVAGIFIDLWDNIVVVRADWITPQLDAFHYYDKDFNFLGIAEDTVEMLDAWDSPTGGAHFSGGIVFDGVIATETPGTPAVEIPLVGEGDGPPARLFAFEGPARVVEAGAGYM
ncbi:hypothetical protein LCGC14_2255140, partial [marine sediment metagenome]